MNRTQNRSVSNYSKARIDMDRAEAELRRAFNKYMKLRERVRRYEKRLDKEFASRAGGMGGKVDWREFGDEMQTLTFDKR